MQERKHACARHCEYSHRLGKTIDRIAPALPQQQQDCRYQRAGMADPDPPHEIGDGEAPGHRDLDTKNPHAFCKQVRHRGEERHQQNEPEPKGAPPKERRLTSQDNGADLIGYGVEALAARDDRRRPARVRVRAHYASAGPRPASCFTLSQRRIGVSQLGQIGGARPACSIRPEVRSSAFQLSAWRRDCSGFLISPNTMACVGHACWHAVWISPSRTYRFSTCA